MKCGLVLLFLLFTLSSCSQSSSTTPISNGIHQSLDALEQSLPKGCETSSIKKTIESIKSQAEACDKACDDRVAIEKQKNKTLMVILISVLAFCGLYAIRKILK